MGVFLSSSGKPAGALNDGNTLFGLDVVCDLIVAVSVSISASLIGVSPFFGTDGVCISSIKTGLEDWRSTGESALGRVGVFSVSMLAVCRRLFLRPKYHFTFFLELCLAHVNTEGTKSGLPWSMEASPDLK